MSVCTRKLGGCVHSWVEDSLGPQVNVQQVTEWLTKVTFLHCIFPPVKRTSFSFINLIRKREDTDIVYYSKHIPRCYIKYVWKLKWELPFSKDNEGTFIVIAGVMPGLLSSTSSPVPSYPDVSNSPKVTLRKNPQGDNPISKCKFQQHTEDPLLLPVLWCEMRLSTKWDCLWHCCCFCGGAFNVKMSCFSCERMCEYKAESLRLLAWVRGRQKWCRKTGMFNIVWFWRACFWALIMICPLYRGWDSSRGNRRRGPTPISPSTCPLTLGRLPPWLCPSGHRSTEAAGFRIPSQGDQPVQILDILLLLTLS